MNKKKGDIRFAAFVITYKRSQLLEITLSKILSQTFPPEEILVVDNSEDTLTEDLIISLNNPKLIYHKVGYNSGPAGAARIGLQKLSEKGYQWIYWGDDNNPPRDETIFNRMLECINFLAEKGKKPGLIAGKGAFLNKWTGRIRALSNSQLKKDEILEVDAVPGGQTLFVNSEIIKKNILPNDKLFFGFEELDFSLKVKKSNFLIYIDAKTWLEVRKNYGDVGDDYRPNLKGKSINWNRQLYSTRNLLHIYYSHAYYCAFIYTFLKSVIKMPFGYYFGFKFGKKNFQAQWSAIKQFLTGKYQNNLKVD